MGMGQGRRKGLRGAWVRALGCAGRHSQSSRMTLASTMTRAPRLMPAPPARSAAAPGRQVPSWPQRHTVTFRGCSRCCGGCPESRSSRLRRYRPSWTWCRSCRRAWLTAEGARGQQGRGSSSELPIHLPTPSVPVLGVGSLLRGVPEMLGLCLPICPQGVSPIPTRPAEAPRREPVGPRCGVTPAGPRLWTRRGVGRAHRSQG